MLKLNSQRFKISFLSIVFVALTIILFALLAYIKVNQDFKEINQEFSQSAAKTFSKLLKHQMLMGIGDSFRQVLLELKKDKKIQRVEVLKPNKKEGFRDLQTFKEVYDRLNKSKEGDSAKETTDLKERLKALIESESNSPQPPLTTAPVIDDREFQIVLDNKIDKNYVDSENQYNFLAPILSEKGCSRCHSEDSSVRGIFKLTLPLRDMKNRGNGIFLIALLLIGLIGPLVFVVLFLYLNSLYGKPFAQIEGLIKRISEGEVDQVIEYHRNDEIGALINGLNYFVRILREKLYVAAKQSSESDLMMIEGPSSKITTPAIVPGISETAVILVTDIRGFTKIIETYEPTESVNLLNQYLELQEQIIEKYEGTIDQVLGDQIFAYFTGENIAYKAVYCSIEVQNEFNRMAVLNNTKDIIKVSIGTNMGLVVKGSLGGIRDKKVSLIGPTINLTKRLCEAADPGQILIGESVNQIIQSNIRTNLMKSIKIKFYNNVLPVYEVVLSSVSKFEVDKFRTTISGVVLVDNASSSMGIPALQSFAQAQGTPTYQNLPGFEDKKIDRPGPPPLRPNMSAEMKGPMGSMAPTMFNEAVNLPETVAANISDKLFSQKEINLLYETYKNVRCNLSQSIDNLTYEGFEKTILAMKQFKYPDKDVSFQIYVKDGRAMVRVIPND